MGRNQKNQKNILRYIRRYSRDSLFAGNLAVTFLLMLSVLAIMFFIAYSMVHSLTDRSVLDMHATLVSRTADEVDIILDEAARMGAAILQDSRAGSFMRMAASDMDAAFVASLSAETKTFPNVFRYLHSLYLYAENSEMIVSNIYNGPIGAFSDAGWKGVYDGMGANEVAAVFRLGQNGYPYFSIIIQHYFYSERVGAAVINIDVRELDKIVVGTGRFASQQVYITDSRGNILYAKSGAADVRHISDVPEAGGVYAGAGAGAPDGGWSGGAMRTKDAGGNNFIAMSVPLRNRSWRLVSALPMAFYDDQFERLRGAMLNLLLAIPLLGAVFTVLLSLKSYLPLKKVIASLEKNGILGEFRSPSGEARGITGLDHIQSLISLAAQDRRNMKAELDRRLVLLNRAQISALQMQITPHFLSNTLDAIHWGAVELGRGENSVSRMILNLSQLFRISLDMGDMLIDVEREAEQCRRYVEIMEYRYPGMISVEWRLSPSILGCVVAKLSFQPIVENAIYHGIKPKKAPGRITVSGGEEGGVIRIRVSDDGAGLSREEADAINAQLGAPGELFCDHVGLRNVNQRIKLIFGIEYGVSISGEKGGGAVTELRFPASGAKAAGGGGQGGGGDSGS